MGIQSHVGVRVARAVVIAAIAALAAGAPAFAQTLTANPPSLNFGTVTVGNAATANVSLTNSGSSSVTIYQLSVSGTGLSVSGMPGIITLGPNQSTSFTATFV